MRELTIGFGSRCAAALVAAILTPGCAEPGAATAPAEEGAIGAAAGTRRAEAEALTAAFPEQATRVLGRAGGVEIAAAAGGFEGRFGGTGFGRLRVALTAGGEAHVRAGDLDIHVREQG